MSDSKLELKIGMFIFIAIVFLIVLVLSVSDFRSWRLGYNLFVRFGFINGVKVGSPVRFRGVDVGEVKAVEIEEDLQNKISYVKVKCWIKDSIKIPQDSSVWVNTLGILGEKYIEIMPGEDTVNFLKPNAMIKGNDPIAIHEITEITKKIVLDIDNELLKLKNSQGTLAQLLYDNNLYKKLEEILDDLKQLTADLKAHPWKLFFVPKKERRR